MGERSGHSVEDLIREGNYERAATVAMRTYGPELMGYLAGVMGDPGAASEVFSRFTEDMWKGLPGFAGRSSFRTWAYRVARNARAKYYRDPFRRRGRRLLTAELSGIAEQIATGHATRAERKGRAERIREQLTPDERELLALRVDKEMPWDEVAEVLGESSTVLRKRFSRLRVRLRDLMRADAGP